MMKEEFFDELIGKIKRNYEESGSHAFDHTVFLFKKYS